MSAEAQTVPVRIDSAAVKTPVTQPDTVKTAPVGLTPDAPVAPLQPRSRWVILGACALITLSTLLLYNVRSR
ncbi:hypothetical protein GCM10023186_38700 [Hymenobacter koreensis]|uniref:Uncharacterized protein n=1 Tax=Hymenobacter koreensis TaxID=1084523 RepID=A0ABP8JGJ3_9BACT